MIIALYLPQFHPVPENDQWWGKGFTEWTNVAKAKPLFPGHEQPHIPGEFGFYDLRLPEIIEDQFNLGQNYGIDGFCFYHYWFGGKLMLQRPVENILKSKISKIRYCLCWANESWTANWVGDPNKILMPQTYPGEDDHRSHIRYLNQYFCDSRYIKVNNKPLLLIHKPLDISDTKKTIALWREYVIEENGSDLFILGVGNDIESILSAGFDGVVTYSLNAAIRDYLRGARKIWQYLQHSYLSYPRWVIPYKSLVPFLIRDEWNHPKVFPDVLPNWDNSPRLGKRALVLTGSKPNLFHEVLKGAEKSLNNHSHDNKILFIKSWNEWAEGNYIEPDLLNGREYLETIGSIARNR